MELKIIAVSKNGYNLAKNLKYGLLADTDRESVTGDMCITVAVKSEFVTLDDVDYEIEGSLADYVAGIWDTADGIIFVTATGIAVRMIAPLINNKTKDPAIVVMDDCGCNVISLLSGHLGGANELTRRISDICGARSVITTASDNNHSLAVDMLAVRNDLIIDDINNAKIVTGAILNKNPIAMVSEMPIVGDVPDNITIIKSGINISKLRLEIANKYKHLIYIGYTCFDELPGLTTVHLIPRNIVVGIGCRKGTPVNALEDALWDAINQNHLDCRSVCRFVSIDLKANEPGILELADRYKLPFVTYSSEQLASVEVLSSKSSFVEDITGVSNVCESAAMYEADELIMPKTIYQGVTIAMAKINREVVL